MREPKNTKLKRLTSQTHMIHDNFTVITCVPSLTGTQLAKTLSIVYTRNPWFQSPSIREAR